MDEKMMHKYIQYSIIKHKQQNSTITVTIVIGAMQKITYKLTYPK